VVRLKKNLGFSYQIESEPTRPEVRELRAWTPSAPELAIDRMEEGREVRLLGVWSDVPGPKGGAPISVPTLKKGQMDWWERHYLQVPFIRIPSLRSERESPPASQ